MPHSEPTINNHIGYGLRDLFFSNSKSSKIAFKDQTNPMKQYNVIFVLVSNSVDQLLVHTALVILLLESILYM